jgi:hypothetical protein
MLYLLTGHSRFHIGRIFSQCCLIVSLTLCCFPTISLVMDEPQANDDYRYQLQQSSIASILFSA